ncbi:phage tail assembly protein [Ancylobacter sonchi]|uniref:phage tail assembly protein n=1 Tax=Ancylobacter sonchi TaxID=1937790 RepID=UPI001BD2006E|nr:phage tail assembly protein [Ancylobacter sonchi]MBS7534248.1 phage tail assembly protein [Ancylobacter sonchi]
MSELVTVELSKPLEHEGKTYSRFTFREPVTGDYAASDLVNGEFNKTLAVLALMAGSTLPVFQKIPMRDFKKISAATQGFLSELAAE